VGRTLVALVSFVCVAVGAATLAPTTAVGRVVLDRPATADGWVRVQQPRRPLGHLIAEVRRSRSLALHSRPFGRVVARVRSRTPFGSPRALGVVATRHGRWLAVTEAGVDGNRIVWVDASRGGLRYARTRLELDVDLSSRTLLVRRGRAVIRRTSIGVGRPGSPTPSGRFAVTDKLNGSAYSAAYGCCILALSAIQPNLPAGWSGGNRVAIHGTLSSSDFGRAVSAGCMHASDADLRYLMRIIPLGTPVVIRQ
jgi:L,D-transpeptidase catalytic domain